jgi:hypothetical protein
MFKGDVATVFLKYFIFENISKYIFFKNNYF